MVHRAIEHGINYLDTAPLYGIGECERLTGLALSGGFREKVTREGDSDVTPASHRICMQTPACARPAWLSGRYHFR